MTYYGGKELAEAFRTVRANTIRIAEDIPEDQYGFHPAADTRSVAQMLAHIGVATHFQTHVHVNKITDMSTVNFGALFQEFIAEENKPRSKAELVALLESEGNAFASYLENVDESFLAETVKLPPGAQPLRFTELKGCATATQPGLAYLQCLGADEFIKAVAFSGEPAHER